MNLRAPGKLSLRDKIFSRLTNLEVSRNYYQEAVFPEGNAELSQTPRNLENDVHDDDDVCSTSSGSSVDDHLVTSDQIDLNSQFFSQKFTDKTTLEQPVIGNDSKMSSEDEKSECDPDERERIEMMLSQLASYSQSCQQSEPMLDSCKKESMENREELELGGEEEWIPLDVPDDDNELGDVEVIINQQVNTNGKIVDVAAQLKRLICTEKREKRLVLHQVHLLCLLGHGFYLNRVIQKIMIEKHEEIMDLLLCANFKKVPEQIDYQFVKTICDIYRIKMINNKFEKETFRDTKDMVTKSKIMLLIAVLRFLAIETRLVMFLDVISKNLPSNDKVHGKMQKLLKKADEGSQFSMQPCDRYPDVPLTTTEILKRKPEFANFAHIPQMDGTDDIPSEGKRPRLNRLTESKSNLWKLKVQKLPDRIAGGKTKSKTKSKNTSPFFSSKSESHTKLNTETISTWIEIFLPLENRWSVLDPTSFELDQPDAVISQLPSPTPGYIFAWDNDHLLRDVSPRYWWHNEMASRRQRAPEKWLRALLDRFDGQKRIRRRLIYDLADRREFRMLRLRAPIPDKVSEFKNHPSYCLKRDLLKFQGIYPPDAPPLGFYHGEAIYARECVHTLHSREVWLRHAKVIRIGEHPYKVVWSKLKREKTELELFGRWQTEEYIPPEPVDGRVPRNAFGNIELFKACMLPKGTVHLKLPNVSKICRKLNVDYAVAVVGFGVHAGGNHPVFDGIVICKEFENVVLENYKREQLEQEKRKHEQRQCRIYGNWKKLIKGMLIRNRLINKYKFTNI
ncbi:DNA repair protein complementing XP-C cells homolog isoform X1 [Uranotaenia lowii]|uniref:DNA repair protein complementing XP-C cells homolog isoform X1 n=1 Tax=Uranotaenia lowii TaxID=190385 RepID=UPI002478CCF4|nr:DNA repair protein complementing XP-C cells homolog isoform X1 [Uranotaenia lowii]